MNELCNLERILILQLSDDVRSCEINTVVQAAENLQVAYHREQIHDSADFAAVVSLCKSSQYDMVYVCGHGGELTVGDSDPNGLCITWPQLAAVLCNSLTTNASFFLACCDGGLRSVAVDLMAGCDDLRYVFGVPRSAEAWQLIAAFTVVLTQLYVGSTPLQAANAGEAAIRADNGHLEPDVAEFRFASFSRGGGSPAPDGCIDDDDIETAVTSAETRYVSYKGTTVIAGDECWPETDGSESCGEWVIDHLGQWLFVGDDDAETASSDQ